MNRTAMKITAANATIPPPIPPTRAPVLTVDESLLAVALGNPVVLGKPETVMERMTVVGVAFAMGDREGCCRRRIMMISVRNE